MGFETAIQSKLKNDIGLSATTAGICPQMFPQQPTQNIQMPFAWYMFHRQDNLVFGAVATGISNYKFEITVLAKSQAEVTSICDRIIEILNGWSSLPDVGMCVLEDTAQTQRATDAYVYYVKSIRFTGIGK